MDKRFEIVTNAHGRRILVLHYITDVETIPEIRYNDFDAIFCDINYMSRHELKTTLRFMSPFKSSKCWIKPRFSRTVGNVKIPGMDYIFDGYADDPLDPDIGQRIEYIHSRIKQLGIPLLPGELHSHIVLCLRLCNYCFVRDFLEFTSTIEPSLTRGYSTLFSLLFNNPELNTREALFKFIDTLAQLNFATAVSHIDRIHLCPDCHSTRLFFIESCPKCQSSQINSESVIHHFRCANVSPESTYEYDGQLRCPKCKHFVRHIGVDYDRPANVFTCQGCGHNFLHSTMRVLCADCGRTHKPSALSPHDIQLFRFTPEGIRIIPTEQAAFKFSQHIWNGFTEFDTYQKQLRWYSASHENSVAVLRFRLEEPGLSQMDMDDFVQNMHIRFYRYNFTKNGRFFYLSHRCKPEEAEHVLKRMTREMAMVTRLLGRYPESPSYTDLRGAFSHPQDNVEDFIRSLSEADGFSAPPPQIQ